MSAFIITNKILVTQAVKEVNHHSDDYDKYVANNYNEINQIRQSGAENTNDLLNKYLICTAKYARWTLIN